MVAEALEALQVRPGGCYVDATLGGGGHAEAILRRNGPDGQLVGCDRDEAALKAARQRLAPYAGRFRLLRMKYADLGEAVPPKSCDGVLMDLGTSSAQMDQAERGFSVLRDGPLDMRMNAAEGLTAADLVNTAREEQLADWFQDLGEEPRARALARAVVRARMARPIKRTLELVEVVERVSPRRGRLNPATKIFMALRMVVNDELGSLKRGLRAAWELPKPYGRLALITFHSGEARVVSAAG